MNLRPAIAAIAAATVIAAVAGFFVGRGTRPAKSEDRTKAQEKTAEVAAKTKETASVQSDSATRRDATVWRTKYVRHPDGTVERTAEGGTVGSSETAAKREETKREIEYRFVDREVKVETVKIVEAEKAAWSIGARAGLSSEPRAVYGAEVGRRLLGPIWAGAYATTAKEIGLMVRWEF